MLSSVKILGDLQIQTDKKEEKSDSCVSQRMLDEIQIYSMSTQFSYLVICGVGWKRVEI